MRPDHTWDDIARVLKQRGLAWTLLTNRVHPTRHADSGIFALRRAVGDAVVAACDRTARGTA